jgi:hypothetical protein
MVLAVRRPQALWGIEAFGAPEPMPARCAAVYTVLVAGVGEAAAVYFAKLGGGGPLVVIDVETSPLCPALFTGIVARLLELAKATRAQHGAHLFTTTPLAAELGRLGQRAQIVDALAKDEMLGVSAAAHIGAGRVRITAKALARGEGHPLGGLLDATTGENNDPLRVAALIGIAIGLDTGRSLAA